MADAQTQVYDPWNTKQEDARKAQAKAQVDQLNKTKSSIMAARAAALESAQGQGGWHQPGWESSVTAPYDGQLAQIDGQISSLNQQMQGLNPDGSAIAPDWRSLVDPETGQLRKQYQLSLSGLDPTQWQGYSKFKGEALRNAGTDSAWASIAKQQQGAEESNAKDAAARQSLQAQSQAMSALGMKGGYTSGTQARAAQMAQRDLLQQKQAVNRQGIMARLDISKTDEAQRAQQLGQLTGYEQDIGKFNKNLDASQSQYNMGNLMHEIEGRRAWEMNQYSEQMKKWATEREAQATEHAPTGGGGK